MTVMIANISPASSSYEDTYNTLNYATRAQTIVTTAQKNFLNVNAHIADYANIIDGLKKENESLKMALSKQSKPTQPPPLNSPELHCY